MTQSINPFAALAARQAARPAPTTSTGQGGELSPAPDAAPQEPPATKTMHVLLSTGDIRFDALLAGCVGRVNESDCFELDPDYARLSYLFTLAAGSNLPVVRPGQEQDVTTDGEIVARRGERTIEVTMPAPAAAALKANLIDLGARGWDSLYRSVAGASLPAGAMGANMLERERQMVAQAVAAYLESGKMVTWDVPVIYRAAIFEENPADRANTEKALLATSSVVPGSIVPDITRTPAPAARDSGAQAQGEGAAADNAIPREWAQHVGSLDFSVEGTLQVRAASAEDAAQVATALLMLGASIPRVAEQLKPTGDAIEAARMVEPTVDDDDTHYDRDY